MISILNKKLYLLLLFLALFTLTGHAQQDAVISGMVIGDDHQPIVNANITVAGSISGTTSNRDGVFQIRVPSGKTITLLISYISFETDSIKVLLTPGNEKQSTARSILQERIFFP